MTIFVWKHINPKKHQYFKTCDSIPRTPPLLGRPDELPLTCIPANSQKIREWFLKLYAASTFNKCTQQLLSEMTDPPLKIDPDAISTAVLIPKHWEKQLKETLDRDTWLEVVGKTLMVFHLLGCIIWLWLPKLMVAAEELSPLNMFCVGETHNIDAPFIQVHEITANTWKSLTNTWNGFDYVSLWPEDQHFTTFLTPWGRYFYKVAPQFYLASGDAYTCRYDESIISKLRKTKCVDDIVL